jgi:hypothetical protein
LEKLVHPSLVNADSNRVIVKIESVHHVIDAWEESHAFEIHFSMNSIIHNNLRQTLEEIAWWLKCFDHFIFETRTIPGLPLLFLAHLTYI